MKVTTIEKLHAVLSKLSSKGSILIKFKIGLFLNSTSHVVKSLEDCKKSIDHSVIEFEQKKTDLSSLPDSEKVSAWNELTKDSAYEAYKKTLTDLEIIYNEEIEVPKVVLSIDDIPDDLEEYSQEEIDLLFTLVD